MNIKSLQKISKKKKKLIIGLMSGTSLDGVDAVSCEITGNGTSLKLKSEKIYNESKGLLIFFTETGLI